MLKITQMKDIKLIAILMLLVLFAGCEDEKYDIEKFGTISGVILDGDSYAPLQGVQVATNPASSSVITNAEGVFEIGKIKQGDVAVSARKKDYLSNTVSVSVYDGELTQLSFYLMKDEKDIGEVTMYDPVPGNGAVNQNLSVNLKWKVDQENKGKDLVYTVYYFVSNSTTQKVVGENLASKEVVLSGLDYNKTYYWYVVAKHEGDRVANSPTWTFKTKATE